MPEYIDIEDIPSGARSRYPWDEWANIPEGKALEITKFMDGRTPNVFCAGGATQAERRGLKLSYRGGRVFVFRKKQS